MTPMGSYGSFSKCGPSFSWFFPGKPNGNPTFSIFLFMPPMLRNPHIHPPHTISFRPLERADPAVLCPVAGLVSSLLGFEDGEGSGTAPGGGFVSGFLVR